MNRTEEIKRTIENHKKIKNLGSRMIYYDAKTELKAIKETKREFYKIISQTYNKISKNGGSIDDFYNEVKSKLERI